MVDVPTIEHVCWVLERLAKHLEQGGSFRQLVHDRFGFGPEAYQELMEAGGMEIANALDWASTISDIAENTTNDDDGIQVEYTDESDRDPEEPN